MAKARTSRLAISAVAGLAGLAANLLPIEALAPLWPGRVITLPVAVFLGPIYGLLAAVVGGLAFSRTAPILVLFFAIEGLLIGRLARRHRSPLLAGGVVCAFWALTIALFPRAYGVVVAPAMVLPL